ncbi:hypothetical protein PCASD_09916 [Puccinia coronata f. sp. avenae]|uniref:Uncharacterized protein n=1 Tax=Puccinia coronata f. sp. avenae TaxID=200324 RepID=A0A2N5UI46_9BASI|nr:hypothetical protein PCASD_09916 [Puccinia coronata f. sp. avenae]
MPPPTLEMVHTVRRQHDLRMLPPTAPLGLWQYQKHHWRVDLVHLFPVYLQIVKAMDSHISPFTVDIAINDSTTLGSPNPNAIAPFHENPSIETYNTPTFDCAISFIVSISEKNPKSKKTSWVALKPRSDLTVVLVPNKNLTLKFLHDRVASKCDKDFNKISCMILDGTHSSPPTITWSGYILKNKKYPKSNPLIIFDECSFCQWISEISSSGHNKGGIIIWMDNPKDEQTRVHKENLLARMMKQLDACRQGPSAWAHESEVKADDELDAPEPEFEDLDVHVDEIFAKYGMVKDYDQIHPVYLDPTDPDRFLLLTSGNVIKWAQKLFLSRKKHNNGAPTAKSDSSGTFVEMLSKCDTTNDLNDYLIFIAIAPHKRDEILDILIDNDIDQFRMFKTLGFEDLRGLGLNIVIISNLRNNVAKYKAHLAKNA